MPTNSKKTEVQPVFHRINYVIIVLGCLTITTGLVLMAGDGSNESTFNPDIFSVRRIVIAPMVCLAGFLVIIIGILWKSSCGKAG